MMKFIRRSLYLKFLLGNQIRLVVERARAALDQITLRETRGERRDREKARDAKEQITEQKF